MQKTSNSRESKSGNYNGCIGLLIGSILLLALIYFQFFNHGPYKQSKGNTSLRTTVDMRDHEALSVIFNTTLPEAITIKSAYTEYYDPKFIPQPDVIPDHYDAIYELEMNQTVLDELLVDMEISPGSINDDLRFNRTVGQLIEADNIGQYFTYQTSSVTNHIYILKDKNPCRVFVRTYGVNYPGFWLYIKGEIENSDIYDHVTNGGRSGVSADLAPIEKRAPQLTRFDDISWTGGRRSSGSGRGYFVYYVYGSFKVGDVDSRDLLRIFDWTEQPIQLADVDRTSTTTAARDHRPTDKFHDSMKYTAILEGTPAVSDIRLEYHPASNAVYFEMADHRFARRY